MMNFRLVAVFCFPYLSMTLHALNPLFDEVIDISRQMTPDKQAIVAFRQGLTLDEVAIKTLAPSYKFHQARQALQNAKTAYGLALQLDPENPVIKLFYEAHDSLIGGSISPGDPDAKLALSFLYDGKADTFDAHDASLDDSLLCAFWLASKVDPENALKAMAPQIQKAGDNSHTKIQVGAVAAGAAFAGACSYALAHFLTENVWVQYSSAAVGVTAIVLTYFTGYLIASCCTNYYGRTNALKKYQDFVKAIAKALPGGPKEVEITITNPDQGTIGPRIDRRRQHITTTRIETEPPEDVLDILPPAYVKTYLNDLAQNGPEGFIVQEVHAANRALRDEKPHMDRRTGVLPHRAKGKRKAGTGDTESAALLEDDEGSDE